MVSGGRKDEAELGAFVNIGVPRPLSDDVDRFLAEHPECGVLNRNEFTRRAIAMLLKEMRQDVHDRLAVDAFKAGKPGPLEEYRRAKR